jgi:tellurite resistance protein
MTPNNRLQHMPISLFAMVMGMAGLTIAWEKTCHLYQLNHAIYTLLLVLTVSVFSALCVLYLYKIIMFRDAVLAEWAHPVKVNFVPAVSISLLLLSIALMPFSTMAAIGLWTAGTALHLVISLLVINSWLHHEKYRIDHLNPAWFIPAVGNVIVPLAGVPLGYPELSWFFFSVGMVFWLILMVIVFNRVIFHTPLPVKLLPTLFILIAPPAVGFLAYMKLTGNLDAFAQILYNFALFLTLLLFSQLPRFARLPFFISWWAYSFPLAAMSIASLEMGQVSGHAGYGWIGIGLLAFLSLLVLMLLLRTLGAARQHRICVEE